MTGTRLLNTQATGERYWLLQEAGDSIHFCHAILPHVTKQQLATLFSLGATINNLRHTLGLNWPPERFGLPALPSQYLDWHGLTGGDIVQAHGYGYLAF